MSVALVTGSSGLIGSEAVELLHDKGLDVVGIDNDMRKYFFGADASTAWNTARLRARLARFTHHEIDIRDHAAVFALFASLGRNIALVVHAAAQPSHDWAAREPFTDFAVNTSGTLVMLEATRTFCPDAPFVFTSTNKVYGDAPNRLPLVEAATRWEIDPAHPFAAYGIDESMAIDQSQPFVFGANKVAADVLVQHYGTSFGMKTGIFRGGCVTGPAHSGAELHGFLAYLVKCCVSGRPYRIYGHRGKQVRDNLHAHDLVSAFWCFFERPRSSAVYNIGGSRHSHCSMLEAIQMVEELAGKSLRYELSDQARPGDHAWYVSDVRKFASDYPTWHYRHDLRDILTDLVTAAREREPHA